MAHEMAHLVLCIRVDFFESSNPTRKHLIKKVRLEVATEGRLGVQLVEGVGLVASGFQFFSRLGSVFAEEVDGFGMFALNCLI